VPLTLDRLGHEYPKQQIRVTAFTAQIWELFPQPTGQLDAQWPSVQLRYLGLYLEQLGCKTIVIEAHYIDRDFIDDLAFFYARSLRGYPNYCQRLHFFSSSFDEDGWRNKLLAAKDNDGRDRLAAELNQAYLGYAVIKPLPGTPIGRTVLQTLGSPSASGATRNFGAVRDYGVHLAGLELRVRGLVFQQQDRGVSACATTALWSAIHQVAAIEGFIPATPAQITESATRYFLPGGRSVPSEGLTIHQICEATRAAGLAPLLIRSVSPEQDRGHLLGYIQSGFPVVLAIESLNGGRDGHAVCAVGVKLRPTAVKTDPNLHFLDAAARLESLYVHDDRLGPYAGADIYTYTKSGGIRTALKIRWPDGTEDEHWLVNALVVPVPSKLRLTLHRVRALGLGIADAIGQLPLGLKDVTLNCRFETGTRYRSSAFAMGLSQDGQYRLLSNVVLSRYIGVVEIDAAGARVMDVVLDATETEANPAILACVDRASDPQVKQAIALLSAALGGTLIS
jgi:hypothetical protein